MIRRIYLVVSVSLSLCTCRSYAGLDEYYPERMEKIPLAVLSIPGYMEKYIAEPQKKLFFTAEKGFAGEMPAPQDLLIEVLLNHFDSEKIALECSGKGSAVNSWNRYAAEQQFSGKNFDRKAERKVFLEKKFGSAASAMSEYFRLLERRMLSAGALSGIGRPSYPDAGVICEGKWLDLLEEKLASATKAADSQSVRDAVETERLVFEKYRGKLLRQIDKDLRRVIANSGKSSAFSSLYGDKADIAATLELKADERHLILILTASEPVESEKWVSKPHSRDYADLWMEDGFEVFLIPVASQSEKGWQFIVNSRGVMWDARHSRAGACDPSWNASNARVKFTQLTSAWQVVLTVPWQDLGFSGIPEKPFLANVYRNRVVNGISRKTYAWSPVRPGAYYQPEKFGWFIWHGEEK